MIFFECPIQNRKKVRFTLVLRTRVNLICSCPCFGNRDITYLHQNYLIAHEENGFLKSEKVGKEKLYLNLKLLEILENNE